MTQKFFWSDPYLTELGTRIQSVHENQVTVRETIFYAFSGGQESDAGTIGGYTVLEARKENKELFYTLSEPHNLAVGDSVLMTIDWGRRYQLMRLHFAAEIILELACQLVPELIKIGAHIARDKARIDFAWEQNVTLLLPALQQQAQDIINSDQEIISAFSDKVNERRYWKIKEFSQVPCGGTHIRRTGEVGNLALKRVNLGKGKERIEIYLKSHPPLI